MKFKLWALALLIAALSLIAGCGGGTSGGGGGNALSPLALFITDDLSTNYDHVWVTIKRVQLIGSTGTRTVFETTEGVTVDLKTLRDGSGARFRFLGAGSIPAGTYSTIQLTLDKDLVLYPTGAATGLAREFNASASGPDNVTIIVALNPPRTLGMAGDDLIVDFDLSQWTDDGTKVTPVIVPGDDTGFEDDDRHEDTRVQGTVSGLSGEAPDLTFTLTLSTGGTIEVRTNVQTNLSLDGPTVLANNSKVEVEGFFDPNTRRMVAKKLEIEIPGDGADDDIRVEGEASDVSEVDGTFVITIREARGFLPTTSTVGVQVNDSTKFLTDDGVAITRAEFFARIDGASEVDVSGAFDEDVLVAAKVELEDELDDDAEIRGSAAGVNLNDKTFVVTVTAFAGLFTNVGAEITVATTVETEFLDDDGQVMTTDAFYAAVDAAAEVQVEGTIEEGTGRLIAKKAKLDDTPNVDEAEVEGPASNIDAVNKTFTLTVSSWEGAFLVSGQELSVATTGTTEFQDAEGGALTAEAFFVALNAAVSKRVDVRGVITGNNFAADRVRLDPVD